MMKGNTFSLIGWPTEGHSYMYKLQGPYYNYQHSKNYGNGNQQLQSLASFLITKQKRPSFSSPSTNMERTILNTYSLSLSLILQMKNFLHTEWVLPTLMKEILQMLEDMGCSVLFSLIRVMENIVQ